MVQPAQFAFDHSENTNKNLFIFVILAISLEWSWKRLCFYVINYKLLKMSLVSYVI